MIATILMLHLAAIQAASATMAYHGSQGRTEARMAAHGHWDMTARPKSLPSRAGYRRAWFTLNWDPGSINADGSRFRRGIMAAPRGVPLGSRVTVILPGGRTYKGKVADRERHDHLQGLPHFDLAMRGNESGEALYRIESLGSGRPHAHRRRHRKNHCRHCRPIFRDRRGRPIDVAKLHNFRITG